jgi:hypothetical protein
MDANPDFPDYDEILSYIPIHVSIDPTGFDPSSIQRVWFETLKHDAEARAEPIRKKPRNEVVMKAL